MFKTTFKTIVFAAIGYISLQTPVLTQTTPNNETSITETAGEQKASNELPEQWSLLYQISDRLSRANGKTQNSWLIKLTPQHDHYYFVNTSSSVNLSQDVFDRLSGDADALACLVAHEMGHQIKAHNIITEKEEAQQISDIEYEAEQEVEERVEQEARTSRRNSGIMGTIGGLLGGDAKKVADDIDSVVGGGGNDIPDREGMYDEILARKQQELEASWDEKYRQQELEADEIAYTYMAKAGYNPEGCVRAIEATEAIHNVNTDNIVIDSAGRVANVRELIAQNPPQTLAQEGKTSLESSEPLDYSLASDNTALQVGKDTIITENTGAVPANTGAVSGNTGAVPGNTGFSTEAGDPNAAVPNATYTALEGGAREKVQSVMVFSNSPFDSGAVETKQEFDANETIYARIIFDRPVYQALGYEYENKDEDGIRRMELEISGLHGDRWYRLESPGGLAPNSFTLVVPQEQKEKNYIDLDILPKPGEESSLYLDVNDNQTKIGGFLNFIGQINLDKWHYENPGYEPMNTYAVTVDLYLERGEESFILHMTPQQHQALAARFEQKETAATNQDMAQRQLPEGFNTPLVPFQDPELSIDNIRRMLSSKYPTILKLAIGPGSQDYEIGTGRVYDVEGINVEGVNSKMTARDIWLAYQDEQGQCFYKSVTFLRDHLGGGQFGELREVWASGGDSVPIACENINSGNSR